MNFWKDAKNEVDAKYGKTHRRWFEAVLVVFSFGTLFGYLVNLLFSGVWQWGLLLAGLSPLIAAVALKTVEAIKDRRKTDAGS